MKAARDPVQRPPDAKLLVVDRDGRISHWARAKFVELLHRGDLVIANDAATLPASLSGRHLPTGAFVEVRLAGRKSLALDRVKQFSAVIFGEGDFYMRTEDRPLPPELAAGDELVLGELRARVTRVLHHPRFVSLEFEGSPSEIWEGLARHGRPIQYSHASVPLALWDVWTPIAGPPVAFEPPSAGFVLDWNLLSRMRRGGVAFTTITHAAGISSTGDPGLDALLPLDEPYFIPPSTAHAIGRARLYGGRIIAIGTTVVRALEHAASLDGVVRAGYGLATQRIGISTRLTVVDTILSGTHEPDSRHYELLQAFADSEILRTMDRHLNLHDYRTHEFGDSIFLEKMRRGSAAEPGLRWELRSQPRSTSWFRSLPCREAVEDCAQQ
jgi:S-adenosylmethionine:tRNA ribosyltransferase-isomerase